MYARDVAITESVLAVVLIPIRTELAPL